MPKVTKKTKEAKARELSKVYVESGLNQAEVGRRKGVTKQAIHNEIERNEEFYPTLALHFEHLAIKNNVSREKAIKFCIDKVFKGVNKVVSQDIVVTKEGESSAKKYKFVPDEPMIQKWFITLCELCGWMKAGNVNVNINNQRITVGEMIIEAQELQKKQVKSEVIDVEVES